MKFDETEKELIASIEKGEWVSIQNLQDEIEKSRVIASSTMTKDQRMNIRIARRDLEALKIKALEEGMPYQTLVSSIIHKYLTGRLVEKTP
jgi:predicted DNA binding CopG/RHH family protein